MNAVLKGIRQKPAPSRIGYTRLPVFFWECALLPRVKARALAHRLYSLAERKRWADEAHAYNILVTSWPHIQAESARLAAGVTEQAGFGLSGDAS